MNPVKSFIARFIAVFGEPNTPDPEIFFAEYERTLRAYSPTVLDKACTRLIDTTTSAFWPTPGQCRVAMNAVAAELAAEARRQAKPEIYDDTPPPSPEAVARMKALIDDAKRAMSPDAKPEEGVEQMMDNPSRPVMEALQQNSRNEFHSKRIIGEA